MWVFLLLLLTYLTNDNPVNPKNISHGGEKKLNYLWPLLQAEQPKHTNSIKSWQ